jgi:hypothetical protein
MRGEGEAGAPRGLVALETAVDPAAIPALLGRESARLERHDPWVWQLGAAWLVLAQLEAGRGQLRHGGVRAAVAIMERLAGFSEVADPDARHAAEGAHGYGATVLNWASPDAMFNKARPLEGSLEEAMRAIVTRTAADEAAEGFWRCLALCGQLLRTLEGWPARRRALGQVELGGPAANGVAAKTVAALLVLPLPSRVVPAAEATAGLWAAVAGVEEHFGAAVVDWHGADDGRMVEGLRLAAANLWRRAHDLLAGDYQPRPPQPPPPAGPSREPYPPRPPALAGELARSFVLCRLEAIGFGFKLDRGGFI